MKLVVALLLLAAAGRVAYSVYNYDGAPTPLRRASLLTMTPPSTRTQEAAEDTPPEEVEDVWHPASWLDVVVADAVEADAHPKTLSTIRARLARITRRRLTTDRGATTTG